MDQCVSPLTSLRDSTRGVLENIEGQPLNKGLANYNKNDPRQVALKDVINVLKALVEETFKTLVDLPVVNTLLAPVLGPILYDLKCIVDDVLDFLENETDAVLNGLGHDCQGSWNEFCSSGVLGLGVGCLL
ncbi:hypothetical protein K435DRAFT_774205 [Dendrothele bispora CBS 962.96]|uniref:Uncharacterized protein n=1 Tax=Dendrothele bispora (strain CBS 962.96) TaxID=1314807 RepID=A0A4S8MPL2_DENBC|nr:hypothetical protein K435DRAFT_774205 [Dendrothele bispora CBS 962.96]